MSLEIWCPVHPNPPSSLACAAAPASAAPWFSTAGIRTTAKAGPEAEEKGRAQPQRPRTINLGRKGRKAQTQRLRTIILGRKGRKAQPQRLRTIILTSVHGRPRRLRTIIAAEALAQRAGQLTLQGTQEQGGRALAARRRSARVPGIIHPWRHRLLPGSHSLASKPGPRPAAMPPAAMPVTGTGAQALGPHNKARGPGQNQPRARSQLPAAQRLRKARTRYRLISARS